MIAATLVFGLLAASVQAQEPLSSKHFTWPDIPYQVSGANAGARGPQFGFNLCNETTQNQDSDCQTMFINSLLDFCMWSSPHNNDTISLSEAYEVAWCTKSGHGTRVIPSGAITGAQLLYAKNYIQLVGYIDQQEINLWSGDEGGELDPHGFDEQGNPLGGLVFTNGFDMNAASFDALVTSNGTPSTNYTQVEEWVNFVGNGIFCMKICNPAGPDAPTLCAHTYDEIGCDYNAPADYGSINGTFEVCDSDDMTPPGVFVTAGATTTWVQPWSGTWTAPYTASIPQSSNCKPYSSEQLFASTATSASATATNSGSASGSSNKGSASPSRTGSSTSTSNTSSSAASRVSCGPSNSLFITLSGVGAAAFFVPLFFL